MMVPATELNQTRDLNQILLTQFFLLDFSSSSISDSVFCLCAF